jgi:tRNA(Ile)-lysidine synthase
VASISKKVRGFQEDILSTIRRFSMLDPADKILVAVSGGPDSIALLHSLYSIRSSFGLKLHIFHLNHMIRGKNSAEDALFVQEQAQTLNVPLTSLSFDIPAYVKGRNQSLQDAAREVRYRLLDQVCDELRFNKIATGHNADDQVETFLMRIIRGAGLSGLTGIPPVRDRIIRPLIEVSREEIEKYLVDSKVGYRLDESNLKMDYLRNRVRHQLIPLCSEENKGFRDNVLNTIALFSGDEDFLKGIADQSFQEVAYYENEGILVLEHTGFSKLDVAIQRRILRKALELIKGDLKEIEFKHIESVLSEMDENGSGEADLPGGIVILNEYGNIVVASKEEIDRQSRFENDEVEINIPGITPIPSLGVDMIAGLEDIQRVSVDRNKKGKKAYLDFRKVELPLQVRTRIPGDRFIPLGMSSEKKLQDYFVDNKIPKRKRNRIPIIESQGQIVWIGRMAIDDRVKVTKDTEKVLVLELK